MAYGTNTTKTSTPSYGNNRPAGNTAPSGKKEFTDDPNEVGIGYAKTAKTGTEYVSIKITKEIPAGASVALFLNDKVKNRTDKTPTHKLKLSVKKA